MKVLNDYLQSVEIGAAVVHRNLTMFPLSGGPGGNADYVTLDAALQAGGARISEVSESGSVPELLFENDGDKPVLLLDGEELVGAKQNRILNLSVMVPAHSKLVIPVSCVEAGRWGHSSRHFRSAGRAHFAAGRSAKMEQVSYSMRSSGLRRSDQSQVWSEIECKMGSMDACSDTQAADALYSRHRVSIDDYAGAFHAAEGQIGAAFAINGRVIGLDLFDVSATLDQQLPKLVQSYALDAIDQGAQETPVARSEDCQRLLSAVLEAQVETFPAVGSGEDLRLSGPGMRGAALVEGERVIHLCLFSADRAQGTAPHWTSRMARASQRRRSH